MRKNQWEPVMFTADCDPDGDGWCRIRNVDPATCSCLGPNQEGVEYREFAGKLFGRAKKQTISQACVSDAWLLFSSRRR